MEGLQGEVLVPLFPSKIALCSHVPIDDRKMGVLAQAPQILQNLPKWPFQQNFLNLLRFSFFARLFNSRINFKRRT